MTCTSTFRSFRVSGASRSFKATSRLQVLDGRVSAGGQQPYRITGLKKWEMLYVHAKATSGY